MSNSIYSSLLILLNKNTAVHCLFTLVHSALTNVTNTTFDFNNVLVKVANNIN